ncbi:MAG: diacylglycerol kinase [bacterium]|nr:diacylglycerol kinase [Gammaproteobacteria bacterium]HIL95075.1 diacylglycerol kinase [Pseudomonadales bacterium]
MSRWLCAAILLPFTVILAPYCVADEKPAGVTATLDNTESTAAFPRDDSYITECGACHLAYPPMLLPTKSWTKLMSGIDQHFEENAELDAETSAYISRYLTQYSMDNTSDSGVNHWLVSIPPDPPIRITELPAFIDDHENAYKLLGDSANEVGFFSPCTDCHKEAVEGIFSEDRLFRGFRHVFKRFSGEESR